MVQWFAFDSCFTIHFIMSGLLGSDAVTGPRLRTQDLIKTNTEDCLLKQ